MLTGAIVAQCFSFRTAIIESNDVRGKQSRVKFIRSAVIGILLVAIAAVLAVETKSLLPGESATKDDVARIREAIESDGTSIIHLKTLHLGPDELLPDVQRVSTPWQTPVLHHHGCFRCRWVSGAAVR